MIAKIETTQAIDTMGEATREDLDRWCDFLEKKLAEAYPDTEIKIKRGGQFTTLRVASDGPDAKDDVQANINSLWDSWS